MAYTVLAPSKQVRAVLVLLCAELCSGNVNRAVPRRGRDRARARRVAHPRRPAVDGRCAARRGQPTNHLRVRRGDRDPGGVRAAEPRLRRSSRAATTASMASRMSAILSDAVGVDGTHRRPGAGPARDRSANQLRDAGAHPSRQDRRAVRRGRRVRRGVGRRRRRADRRALGLREEPRAGVPDRRRPARRRRRSGVDRQGGARRRAQDDVRLVQRRRRGAAARRRAVRHRGSRALAVRRESAIGCASCPAFVAGETHCERPGRSARRRSRASSSRRSAISTPASIASCSRRRAARAARWRWRRAPACGSACSAASLLGPAAAIGLGARLPGLVSGVRDALRPGALSRRAVLPRASPSSSFLVSALAAAFGATRDAGFAARARVSGGDAGWVIAAGCLVYLTFWWRNANAGFGWSAPVWTAFALAVAVGISLLLGHAVRITTLAVLASGRGAADLPPVPARRGGCGRRRRAGVRGRRRPARADRAADRPAAADHPPLTVVSQGIAVRLIAIDGFDPAIYDAIRERAPAVPDLFGGASCRSTAAGHRRSGARVDDDRDRRAAGGARRPRPRDDAARRACRASCRGRQRSARAAPSAPPPTSCA